MKPEVMLIMPAYNEQASVRKVVLEWFEEVENWTEDFVFFAIDDGSTDETLQLLKRLQSQLGPKLEVRTHTNVGHGQCCLVGYREACKRAIPFVFQIDSDGQCDPQYFFRFWRDRHKFDVVYGRRHVREDGWRRVAASYVLRATLLATAGVNCVDANVPYRLMRTQGLVSVLERIPTDFFLANVALAVLLRRERSWRHGHIPIRFRERYGGEPSVALGNFGHRALQLRKQLRTLTAGS